MLETAVTLGSAQKLLTILSAKCSVFLGLLQTNYGKLFLNDPLFDVQSKWG
jgi:hypothetical protein